MNNVDFKDYSVECTTAINEALRGFLEEAGGEIESQAKRNTRVDTGKTKMDWDHVVDMNANKVTIGNPDENSIWEEFGTGIHGINGRKTPWKYKDRHGEWHTTRGKKGTKGFQKAFDSKKSAILSYLQKNFKEKIK